MGFPKQLLPWKDGRSVLETVVHTVLACPEVDDQVRVVLGSDRDRIVTVLQGISDPRLRILDNVDYAKGMLSSVKLGLTGLPPASTGFIIFLGDQPLIMPELVGTLVRHWRCSQSDFLIPVHQGRRGHPVIVSRAYVDEISGMEDEEGGLRGLVRRYPERVEVLEVESPAIHIDLDYPEEYRKYRPGGGE